jgi:hypothetical protein
MIFNTPKDQLEHWTGQHKHVFKHQKSSSNNIKKLKLYELKESTLILPHVSKDVDLDAIDSTLPWL